MQVVLADHVIFDAFPFGIRNGPVVNHDLAKGLGDVVIQIQRCSYRDEPRICRVKNLRDGARIKMINFVSVDVGRDDGIVEDHFLNHVARTIQVGTKGLGIAPVVEPEGSTG